MAKAKLKAAWFSSKLKANVNGEKFEFKKRFFSMFGKTIAGYCDGFKFILKRKGFFFPKFYGTINNKNVIVKLGGFLRHGTVWYDEVEIKEKSSNKG